VIEGIFSLRSDAELESSMLGALGRTWVVRDGGNSENVLADVEEDTTTGSSRMVCSCASEEGEV